MRSHSRGHHGRLATGAILLLLYALCSPSSARASCGDHVVSSPAVTADPRAADGIDFPDPPPTHRPCSGPQCSGRQSPPAPLTAVVVSPELDPHVLPTGISLPQQPPLTSPLADPGGDPLARLTSAVYRPPRASAV